MAIIGGKMEYNIKKHIVRNMNVGTIRVKDRYRDRGHYVNRTIMPKEYAKIRPGKGLYRFDFKFNARECIEVELDLAEYLKEKYPSTIYFVDELGNEIHVPDEFTPLDHRQMMKVVGAYNRGMKALGLTGCNMMGKTEDLRNKCREMKGAGVTVDLEALGVITDSVDESGHHSEEGEE